MNKEYKVCTELISLTPEMLKNWDTTITGDTYQVKRQVFLRCPKTEELIPESQCLQCIHNFGQASDKWVYCLPETDKPKGKRK